MEGNGREGEGGWELGLSPQCFQTHSPCQWPCPTTPTDSICSLSLLESLQEVLCVQDVDH